MIEYYNKERGDKDLFSNIESGHHECDKLKKKGGHLVRDDGGSTQQFNFVRLITKQ